MGGPEVRTLTDTVRACLNVTKRRRKIPEVPLPGKTARALRDGALTCPAFTYGKIRWEEFLQHKVGDPTAVRAGIERT